MAITSLYDLKIKNKGTLFSQTLKVGENKVPLVFHLGVKWRSYGNFSDLLSETLLSGFKNQESSLNSPI